MKFTVDTDSATLDLVQKALYFYLDRFEYEMSDNKTLTGFDEFLNAVEDALVDDRLGEARLALETKFQSSIAQDDETPLDIFNI